MVVEKTISDQERKEIEDMFPHVPYKKAVCIDALRIVQKYHGWVSDEAVKELGGLPKLEKYVSGSGIPPKFIAGTPDQVHEQLTQIQKDLSVDEIMVQDMMTDHQARLNSYKLLASIFKLKGK